MKIIKILSEHRKICIWFALVWTAIVAYLCLVTFDKISNVGIDDFDKFGHFLFHYILTAVWFLYYKFQRSNTTITALKRSFLFSSIYGIAIEISQALFTTSRKADVFDVVANMIGSITAVVSIIVIAKLLKKIL